MNILIILTSHDQLGNTGLKTGFWLEELAAPYYVFKDNGATLTLASPLGGLPPLDPKSNDETAKTDDTRRFEADAAAMAALSQTLVLKDVKAEDFDAVFYPGGHGPLWDLAEDASSQKIIADTMNAGKPLAAVCHAPGVFRHVKGADGRGDRRSDHCAVHLRLSSTIIYSSTNELLGGLRMTPRSVKSLFISTTAASLALLFCANPALADCTPDATGLNFSCTGTTTTGVSATVPNVNITVQSTASVTTLGLNATGVNSSVHNIGTINTGSVNAITLGGNGTVTQDSAATGAITGGIVFGAAVAGQVNTLTNANTSATLGIAGNITSIGNTSVTNAGTISGYITETAGTGAPVVTITNNSGATITGAIATVDTTNINNAGTITGNISGAAPLTVNNSGTLTGNISLSPAGFPSGVLSVNNTGTITGNISESQSTTAGSVTLVNGGAGATYTSTTTPTITGVLALTDPSVVTNYGTLNVTGSINGNLFNYGTLGTGSATAPGSLAINGNFTQLASGTYTAYFTPSAGGTIQVSGTANVAGTLNLQPSTGFYPSGKVYDVVVANGGITGGFSNVTTTQTTSAATSTTTAATTTTTGTVLSPFLTFVNNGIVSTNSVASPTQQAYQFTVTRTPYATALAGVATANQLAVAGSFQNLVTVANTITQTTPAANAADAGTLVGGVDFLTVAQAQTFFDQISPQGYGAYVSAVQDQATLFNRQVSLRLDTLGLDNVATGPWATPYYQRGTASGTYGSGENIIGFAAGYDAGGEHKRAGVSLGYSSASVNYKVGGLTGTDSSFQIGVYGGLSAGHLKADLQLDYINGSISTSKLLTLNTSTRTATASSSANLFKAVGTLAYNLGNTDNKFQPFVGIDYLKGKINGFTEAGAATADLTVNSLTADRTDVLVGIDYARLTGTIKPYIHADYRYNLTTPNAQITAFFAADPSSTPFTVTGTTASRSQEDLNVGVRFAADDDGSYFFLGYQGIFRSGLTSHGVNAGLFVAF